MADEYFVPTRSSRVLGAPVHEVVVHTEKKGSESKSKKTAKKEKSNSFDDLDMKAARFELYKFAQTAQKNIDKQKDQKALAIKLGAVPPKNKSVNYKELKELRKKQREKEAEEKELVRLGRIHRPERSYDQSKLNKSGRNPKAQLRKKLSVGTGIMKNYGTVKK